MESTSLSRTHPGAAIYSTLVLKCYDAWVLGFSNRWAWRCPTKSVLLPFYRQHLGQRHLEVGAGSGYYLAHAGLNAGHRLTLLDMNPSSLNVAASRAGIHAERLLGDAMQAGEALQGRSYDSIALFYLLHCLSGDMAHKAQVFAGLKKSLSADGVLYGATILGDEAGHNFIGRKLMRLYNRKGIFGNQADTEAALHAALSRHFRRVEIRRHGRVALFAAREPILGVS
jgi:SAM-dependent methyltransferase